MTMSYQDGSCQGNFHGQLKHGNWTAFARGFSSHTHYMKYWFLWGLPGTQTGDCLGFFVGEQPGCHWWRGEHSEGAPQWQVQDQKNPNKSSGMWTYLLLELSELGSWFERLIQGWPSRDREWGLSELVREVTVSTKRDRYLSIQFCGSRVATTEVRPT